MYYILYIIYYIHRGILHCETDPCCLHCHTRFMGQVVLCFGIASSKCSAYNMCQCWQVINYSQLELIHTFH